MRIAVTGGSGFIGKHLINELLKNDYYVNALSRVKRDSNNKNLKWFEGDLNDRKSLNAFLENCDVVCNCAGEISNPENFQQHNVEAVKKLYQASTTLQVDLFIQMSSAGIYKIPTEGVVEESSDFYAYDNYEESKINAEKWLYEHKIINTVILRPTTVYGDDMPNQSLKNLFSAIQNKRFFYIGSKEAYSCYISVDNVVDAISKILSTPSDEIHAFETYNLSHDISYKDFIQITSKLLQVDNPNLRVPLWTMLVLLWFNETFFRLTLPLTVNRARTLARRSYFSSLKLQKDFSWSPPISHCETIGRCIEAWFPKK